MVNGLLLFPAGLSGSGMGSRGGVLVVLGGGAVVVDVVVVLLTGKRVGLPVDIINHGFVHPKQCDLRN